MVINTKKNEWFLRYPIGTLPHQTALCRLQGERVIPPENSTVFNGDAARAAAALSMSADDEKLLTQNLKELGFGDIRTFAYAQPDRDKIGLAVGSRTERNTLQVAAVLRSTCGEEWFSNFDVGYTAEHSGFAKAADFAELKIGDYVFTRAIGMEPVFFITGYSRGGAVANILAKRLCDRYGLERVCAYTFASPATTISRRTGRYGSIFNFVRQEDFFTRVPPAGWGYSRYGRDVSLSDAGDISESYRKLTGEDYIGFTRQAAVDDFLAGVMTLSPNVLAYYRRRRQVGDRNLSLHEFMCTFAQLLAQQPDDSSSELFLDAMVSDYAGLVNFLSSGADLAAILSSAIGVPKCSVADSHCPAAYIAALVNILPQ